MMVMMTLLQVDKPPARRREGKGREELSTSDRQTVHFPPLSPEAEEVFGLNNGRIT
ncbi:hypothetical protein MPTK2_3g04890 [Marchantia polymorpha subsp. ruderalis]